MKQIQILALFVLSILVVFTSQTNNLQTVNNINRLVGFKCNGVTKLSTPIRLSRSGEIQCFSLDGQNCVYGLNTDDDCRNYVIKNIDKLNPVTCSRDKYESKGHWCKKGFKYFFKTWHCQADTGLNIAVKFNYGRFGVECLSKNGKDCIRGKHFHSIF